MSHVELNIVNDNIVDYKLHIFNNIAYYRVMGMRDSYYLKVSDYANITLKQNLIILYKETIKGFITINSYIKSIECSDILFIAAPTVENRFKMCDLEKA